MWLVLVLLVLALGRQLTLEHFETEIGIFRSSEVQLDLDYQLAEHYHPYSNRHRRDQDLKALARWRYGEKVLERCMWIPYEVGSRNHIGPVYDTAHPGKLWRYSLIGYMLLSQPVTNYRFVETIFFEEGDEREEYYCYYELIEDGGSWMNATSYCFATDDYNYSRPILRLSVGTSEPRRSITTWIWP